MSAAEGVEALPGETEAQYVARQARLREEAAARMRAKFGASGGLNGKLGGYGPSGYSSGGGGSGGNAIGFFSSLSSAASMLGSSAAAALGTAAEVASSGAAAAATVVSSGLERVQQPAFRTETNGRASVGFGRDSTDLSDLLGGGSLVVNNRGSRSSSSLSLASAARTSEADEGGVEPLPGESDAQYAARQTRLREAAATRMRAKFGASNGLNGKLGGCGPCSMSSCDSGDLATMLNSTSLEHHTKPVFLPPTSSTHSADISGTSTGRVKKVAASKSTDSWDDFDDNW